MKKIFLLFCFLLTTTILFPQFSVSNVSNDPKILSSVNGIKGVDYIFILEGINSSTEITYNWAATTIEWYDFSDLTTPVSNANYFSPEAETGYLLKVDGKNITLWVFDYGNYKIDPSTTFLELIPEEDMCETIELGLSSAVVPMLYKDMSGTGYSLERNFSLAYSTLSWSDGNHSWGESRETKTFVLPKDEIKIETPLMDTKFILEDQFSSAVFELDYTAIAVEGKIAVSVSYREETNEDRRPESNDMPKEGYSSPVHMFFESNPSIDHAMVTWKVFRGTFLTTTRTEKDHRYTFTELGTYKVELEVKNPDTGCTYSDSITNIVIRESALQVPNVFTPNNDDIHDEFRVAYRSLAKFDCWVYNNWGKLVYHWSDPAKGWDGKINGKYATPGAYFYIIKAVGTDGVKYSKKGDINLIR